MAKPMYVVVVAEDDKIHSVYDFKTLKDATDAVAFIHSETPLSAAVYTPKSWEVSISLFDKVGKAYERGFMTEKERSQRITLVAAGFHFSR